MKLSSKTMPMFLGVLCIICMVASCSSDCDAEKKGANVQPGKNNGDKGRPPERGELDKAPNTMHARSASFSPDGKRFVVGFTTKSGTYTGPKWKMWDVETGKEVKTNWPNFDFGKKYADVYFISYLPDGKRILTQETDGWRIWDAEKIEVLREFDLGNVYGIGPSADGEKMLARNKDGLGVFNLKTGAYRVTADSKTMPLPHSLWLGAAWTVSPDGHWAFVHSDSRLAYIDLKNKKAIYDTKGFFEKTDAEKHDQFLHPIVFSPDGKTVVASRMKGVTANGIALCDAATLKVMGEIPEVRRVKDGVFTADGEKLLILDLPTQDGYPQRLRCWEVKSKRELWGHPNIREPSNIQVIVPSPKGDFILLVNQGLTANAPKGTMVLLSTKTGELVSRPDAAVFPHRGDFRDPKNENLK
jgi:WD40 repeat protein